VFTCVLCAARLLRQPDVAIGAGNGNVIGDVVDDVILPDVVFLPLVEQASDQPDGLVRG